MLFSESKSLWETTYNIGLKHKNLKESGSHPAIVVLFHFRWSEISNCLLKGSVISHALPKRGRVPEELLKKETREENKLHFCPPAVYLTDWKFTTFENFGHTWNFGIYEHCGHMQYCIATGVCFLSFNLGPFSILTLEEVPKNQYLDIFGEVCCKAVRMFGPQYSKFC